MGRHSADRWSFYRSLGAAVLRVAVIVGVVGGLVTLSIFIVLAGRDSPPEDVVAVLDLATSPATRDTADVAASRQQPPPALLADANDEDLVGEAPDEPQAEEAFARPGQGITVQVLDGGGDRALATEVASHLRELGYEVVALHTARQTYTSTTILHAPGRLGEARALRAHDPRFGVIAPNTSFTAPVDLHVVVGRDWPRR